MSYFGQIRDQQTFVLECTPFSELKAIIPIRIVGATFEGTTLDTSFWTSTIVASGGTIATIVVGSGEVIMDSKTDATGGATLQSVRRGRYIGNSSNQFRAEVQFGDTGHTNNTKKWGIYDGTNGSYFKLSGTALSVNTLKAGSETSIASASWNKNTTVPTLTNCNSWEIYTTFTKIYFVINEVLVHVEDTNTRAGAANDTWTATLNLPVRAENINSGNTTSTTMSIRLLSIYRLGPLTTATAWRNQVGAIAATVIKNGPGILHRVVNNNNAGTLALYDAVTATNPIASIDLTKITGGTLEYQASFYTALTIVTTGACDVTIVYE